MITALACANYRRRVRMLVPAIMALFMACGCAPVGNVSVLNATDENFRVQLALPWPFYQVVTHPRHFDFYLEPDQLWHVKKNGRATAFELDVVPRATIVLRIARRGEGITTLSDYEIFLPVSKPPDAEIRLSIGENDELDVLARIGEGDFFRVEPAESKLFQ